MASLLGFVPALGLTFYIHLYQGVFSQVLGKRKRPDHTDTEESRKKKARAAQDTENYIPYRPKDFDSEKG